MVKDDTRLKDYHREYYKQVTKKKRHGEEPGSVPRAATSRNKKKNNPFYIKVDELSIKAGYNNTTLAEAMDVKYSSLNNWLKMNSDIPVMAFFKMCELLNVDPSELYQSFAESKNQNNL